MRTWVGQTSTTGTLPGSGRRSRRGSTISNRWPENASGPARLRIERRVSSRSELDRQHKCCLIYAIRRKFGFEPIFSVLRSAADRSPPSRCYAKSEDPSACAMRGDRCRAAQTVGSNHRVQVPASCGRPPLVRAATSAVIRSGGTTPGSAGYAGPHCQTRRHRCVPSRSGLAGTAPSQAAGDQSDDRRLACHRPHADQSWSSTRSRWPVGYVEKR
jgi:hypothetical protein